MHFHTKPTVCLPWLKWLSSDLLPRYKRSENIDLNPKRAMTLAAPGRPTTGRSDPDLAPMPVHGFHMRAHCSREGDCGVGWRCWRTPHADCRWCSCVVVPVSELRSPSMSDFLQGLENSGWLKHIKAVLDASVFIAKVSLGPNPRCLPPHWLNIGLGAGPQRPVMSCRRTVSLRISSPRSSFRKKLKVDGIIEKKKTLEHSASIQSTISLLLKDQHGQDLPWSLTFNYFKFHMGLYE